MLQTKRIQPSCLPIALTLGLLFLAGCNDSNSSPSETSEADSTAGAQVQVEHPSEHLRVTEYPGGLVEAELSRWNEQVPEVKDIEIPASADGASQKALFYDSGSDQQKPLLLVLHSWSTDYLQNIDIPIAQFAVANDWVFMHPDFRGQNDGRPESTASELAISDMQDALDYARENANIDPQRIYLLGYSGGAMNAMHLASRHPDVFAGVSLWVPVYDLIAWYEWNDSQGAKYAGEIADACGGAPEQGTDAHAECLERSPRSRLQDVRGEFPVHIAHGLGDETVPPEQALRAFNDLAEEDDRIAPELIEQLNAERSIPEALRERSIHQDGDYPRFEEANAEVVLHLQSGPAELVIFEGEHDMLYRPGLDWLARQRK